MLDKFRFSSIQIEPILGSVSEFRTTKGSYSPTYLIYVTPHKQTPLSNYDSEMQCKNICCYLGDISVQLLDGVGQWRSRSAASPA